MVREPLIILRAFFCINWRDSTLDRQVAGYQMGAAYDMMGLIRALYVTIKVSFCWPLVVPARALRMLRRALNLAAIAWTWGVKVKDGSRVTPRILGCRSRGSTTL